MKKKIKVIYICGSGRSGTTLLSMLLGEINGCFDAGEIRYLWERAIIEEKRCGCGNFFSECSFWGSILRKEIDRTADVNKKSQLTNKILRYRNLLNLNYKLKKSDTYIDEISLLYKDIYNLANQSIIIDSSKLPQYAYILSKIDSIELCIIHLVRNHNSVCYSWSKPKKYEPNKPDMMNKIGTLKSSSMWLLSNLLSHFFWDWKKAVKYKLISYDSFTKNPEKTIYEIGNYFNIKIQPNIFSKKMILSKSHHTIAGNPIRFSPKELVIKNDNRWISDMPLSKRILSTVICSPLLLFYRIKKIQL